MALIGLVVSLLIVFQWGCLKETDTAADYLDQLLEGRYYRIARPARAGEEVRARAWLAANPVPVVVPGPAPAAALAALAAQAQALLQGGDEDEEDENEDEDEDEDEDMNENDGSQNEERQQDDDDDEEDESQEIEESQNASEERGVEDQDDAGFLDDSSSPQAAAAEHEGRERAPRTPPEELESKPSVYGDVTNVTIEGGHLLTAHHLESMKKYHDYDPPKFEGEWQGGWDAGESVGEGGMGIVYLFRRTKNDHIIDRVAVKDTHVTHGMWTTFSFWYGDPRDSTERRPMEIKAVSCCC